MISKDDLGKYRAFKKIVKAGTYDLKGEAVIVAALLFKWFDELEGKVSEKPVKRKKPVAVKKPPIRKIGS